ETRCSLSQYCEALRSDTRASVLVEGAPKSVGNTGSQITNTRTLGSRCSSSSFWIAEAPCKHTVQVGDSITTKRTEFAEPLNASLSDEILEPVRRTSGCCPLGTVLPSKSNRTPPRRSPPAHLR